MAKKYIDAYLLREEVEEQIDCAKGVYPKGSMEEARATAITAVCLDILAFISSLQQEEEWEGQRTWIEQPCDTCTNDKGCVTCKDGELWEGKEQPSKDLRKEFNKWLRGVEKSYGGDLPHFGEYGLFCVARHFAEWQKDQMPMPEDTVLFNKGVAEGRRLEKQDMLKDAVEGYVNYYEDSGGKLMAEAQVGCPYHIGDKVKIIIVPIKED